MNRGSWPGLPERVERLLQTGSTAADWEDLSGVAFDVIRGALEQHREGRPDEAIGPARDVLRIRRRLVDADPGRYMPGLATVLSNLGVFLFAVGEHAEALELTEEAASVYRRLREAGADVRENLGNRLAAVGRFDEALPVTEEAVTIRRELAVAHPERYLRDLAGALNNLGVRWNELGKPEQALVPAEEAVAIRRSLIDAAVNGTAHEDWAEFAAALNNAAMAYAEAGDHAGALAMAEEAAGVYQQLAEVDPRHLGDVATTLSNLAKAQYRDGRMDQAIASAEEAATTFSRVAAISPGVLGELSTVLNNLGVYRAASGQHVRALEVTQAAEALARQLAEINLGYLGDLALTLNNLGVRLSEARGPREGLAPAEESVTILRALARAYPQRYHDDLRDALTNLANRLTELGHHDRAADCRAEAARVRHVASVGNQQ
jgi:tetratricopeptide (TPR) repeat protein